MANWVRRWAKATAAGGLHYSGLRAVLAHAGRVMSGGRRVLIVAYHRVVEDFESEARRAIPGLLISQATFARHVDALRDAGYEIVPLAAVLPVLAGTRRARRDLAVVTFDDGYRDVYDSAFPILKSKGVPATVYLATGYVGTDRRFAHDRIFQLARLELERRLGSGRGANHSDEAVAAAAAETVTRLIDAERGAELERTIATMEKRLGGAPQGPGACLTWDMVREMSGAGVQLGAHTVDHLVLTHETHEAIARQIEGSRREIEERTGRPVRDFAYCNGYYDRRVVAALTRSGFRSAVTTEDSLNQVGTDLFRLRRKTLWENFSQGPFGYSAALTRCHLDDVFTLLGLSRPIPGDCDLPGRTGVHAPSAPEGPEAQG